MATKRGVKAGRAFIELSLVDDALRRGLKRAQAQINRFGTSLTSVGAKMTALGASLAIPLGAAVKAAGDFEATMAKFNLVFAENSKAVLEWSDNLSTTLGRSKSDVAQFLAATQDLFVPLGFERNIAADMSKDLVQLGLDIAAFNKRADADVIRDLQSALVGAHRVMLKYGVVINEANIKQRAFQLGMDPKNLTDQQKALARLQIILAGTTDAQGAAARMADTFDGSIKRLRGSVENLAGDMGDQLLPVVSPLAGAMSNIVDSMNAFTKANPQLVTQVTGFAAAVTALGVALTGLGVAMSLLGPSSIAVLGLGSLVALTTDWERSLKDVTAAIGGVGTALKNEDFEAAGRLSGQAFKTAFLNALKGLTDGVKNVADYLGSTWISEILGSNIRQLEGELRLIEERIRGERNRQRLQAQLDQRNAEQDEQERDWRDPLKTEEQRIQAAWYDVQRRMQEGAFGEDPIAAYDAAVKEMARRRAEIANIFGQISQAISANMSEAMQSIGEGMVGVADRIRDAWGEIQKPVDEHLADVARLNEIYEETRTPLERFKEGMKELDDLYDKNPRLGALLSRKEAQLIEELKDSVAGFDGGTIIQRGGQIGGQRLGQVFGSDIEGQQLEVAQLSLKEQRQIKQELKKREIPTWK